MSRFVLVTRHPADCVELQAMVSSAGITIRPYPVFRLEEVDDDADWAAVLDGEAPPSWILMASPRAPERLVHRCRKRNTEHLLELPVAEIVGPGTGLGLAKMLIERWTEPTNVIFACGHHRRPELPNALTAAGHTVDSVVLYRMQPTPPRELPPLPSSLDAVVVTSPRAARLYLEGVGGRPLPCTHWALGPTTRDAARDMGIECRIPPTPSIESLAEALCRS
jgi:uroporphyrinogen-III synthase